MAETVRVVCVAWGDETVPSVKRQCWRCGKDVAVSEGAISGYPESAEFSCGECFMATAADADEIAVTPETVAETRELIHHFRALHGPYPWKDSER